MNWHDEETLDEEKLLESEEEEMIKWVNEQSTILSKKYNVYLSSVQLLFDLKIQEKTGKYFFDELRFLHFELIENIQNLFEKLKFLIENDFDKVFDKKDEEILREFILNSIPKVAFLC